MGGKRLPSCRHCGRKFRPDLYNHHHHEWCSEPECRRARDRERKRKHYRRRMEREEQFRESERQRCREAMRRCRSRRKQSDDGAAVAVLAQVPAQELLTGLVSHLADTSDPYAVAQMMSRYAERGRRLAVAPRVRGSP